MIKPLGDRILIKPIVNPTTTDSGLHLVEDRKPETSGTVVEVGLAVHPLREEAKELAAKLRRYAGTDRAWADSEDALLKDVAHLLLQLTHREPLVKAGDVVLFSWQSGQELFIGDDRYLLMREDDVLAVLEE